MAALLSFRGLTLIDNSPTAAATNITSGGLYGVAKLLSLQQRSIRTEYISYAGAAGMRPKTLGAYDTISVARTRVLGTDGSRPARVFHTDFASMRLWINSVEAYFLNPDNRKGTLVFNGETLTNMYLDDIQFSPITARFNFAPGGVPKGCACDISATWFEVL